MKKIGLLLALVMCLTLFHTGAAAGTAAHGTCGTGLAWTLSDDGVLTVSGAGAMTDYAEGTAPWEAYAADIKAVTVEDGVTTVGAYAFADLTGLETLSLPDTLTQIREYAFTRCASLKTLEMPQNLKKIGQYAFNACTALNTVEVSPALKTVEKWAFYNCAGIRTVNVTDLSAWCGIAFAEDRSNPAYYAERLYVNGALLTRLDVPEDVTEIKSYTFCNNQSLSYIYVPANVTAIRNYAFFRCNAIKTLDAADLAAWCGVTLEDYSNPVGNVTRLYVGSEPVDALAIPDGVTEIKAHTFEHCLDLTKITIPESVTAIGSKAFSLCTSLTEVSGMKGLTTVGYAAFYACSALERVDIADADAWCGVDFYDMFASPVYFADDICVNGEPLKTFSPGADVTKIPAYAFYGCESLEAVNLPETVTSVGASAFENCKGLKTLNIANHSTALNSRAFAGCTALESGTMGDNLSWTFADGTLTVTGEGKMRDFGSGSAPWAALANVAGTVEVKGLTRIGKNAFYGFKAEEFRIPATVTEIGEYAFSQCSKAERVVIEDLAAWCGVTFKNAQSNPLSGGAALYLGEERVTDLAVPAGVTEVNAYAFYGCDGFETVSLPESVTQVGEYAFYNNFALKHVSYKNPATKLGRAAFAFCAYLEEGEAGGTAWRYDFETDTLTVSGEGGMPQFSETANPPWRHLMANITKAVLEEGITDVGAYAFDGGRNLTGFTLADTVTSIGACAFRGCGSLTEITVPDTVTSIGGGAFGGCTALTEITVPFIGMYADASQETRSRPFGHIFGWTMSSAGKNEAAQSMYDSEEATAPAFSAFYGVPDSLKKVTVTGGDIRRGAFENCKYLETVILADGVSGIGKEAFRGCYALTDVSIPEGVTEIGASAFESCTSLTGLSLPETVRRIGARAFNNCTKLASLDVPPRVTEIEDETFRCCELLGEVKLGCGVCYIGASAFQHCPSLIDLFFGGSEEAWNAVMIEDGNDAIPDEVTFTNDAHVYVEEDDIKPATCTEDGYYDEMVCCKYCGEVLESKKTPIEATGHLMSIPERLPPETPEQEYILRRVCRRCGFVEDTPVMKGGAVRGDVDGSGKTTAADARMALRAAVKLDTLTTEQHAAADVNGDGNVRADDARTILRIAVNLEH